MPRLGSICSCGHAYIAHVPGEPRQQCLFCNCADFEKARAHPRHQSPRAGA